MPSRVSRPETALFQRLFNRPPTADSEFEAVRAIAELLGVTVSLRGEEFLNELALQLTRLLEVDICLINRVQPDDPDWLQTMGAARAGQIMESTRYPAADTPCAVVLQGSPLHIRDDLARLFPKDKMAIDEGWVSYYGVPLWDENREVIGEICILDVKPMEDVSFAEEMMQLFAARATNELEVLQAREDARLTEQTLQAFAAEIPGWLCAYRSSNEGQRRKFLFTNDQAARFIGPKHFEELKEDLRVFNELIHPEDRARVEEVYSVARDTESNFSIEYRVRHDSGEYRWVQAHGCFSFLDAESKVCHAVMLDYEHIRSLEIERNILTKELRTLVSSIPDAVFLQDARGRVRFLNEAAESLLGLQASQVIGANFRGLAAQFPELAETFHRAADHTEQCLASLEPLTTQARRRMPATHADREYETRRVPLFDSAGAPTGLVTVVRDQTAELEAQRREQSNQRERTRLAAQSRLVDKVAHEFENQLTAILGYNTLIDQRLTANLESVDSWLRRALDGVQSAGQTASDLARGLLVFGRGGNFRDQDHCDPEEVLRAARPVLQATVGNERNFRLEVEGPAPLRDLELSQAGLASVLYELARNAREATQPKDRIEFLAQTAVALEDGTIGFRLTVRDTGCGIPDQVRTRLFEPMSAQEDVSPRMRGMGLALVHARIEQANGSIRVDSAADVGTTFTIELPYSRRARQSKSQAKINRRLRVLAIDDKAAMRELLREILEAGNYQVELFGGCTELRERLDEIDPPDIALLDVHLEDGLGTDLVAELEERWPELRLVFCSGLPRANLASHGIHLPPDAVLVTKPFRPTQLLSTLAAAAV